MHKIYILHMKSHIGIPDEIDEKLKKNHNLLLRRIRKTQIFLVFQQISAMMGISSLIFLFLLLFPFPYYPRLFLILLFSFIGLVIFLLYILIRYIAETIDIHREYSLKEKQNLNYLSEELLLMIKIYTSKFRLGKKIWNVRKLRQDTEKSMDEKMRIIFKDERNFLIYDIIYWTAIVYMSFFHRLSVSGVLDFIYYTIDHPFLLFANILMVSHSILTYLILRYTNKWLKGYHELNAWGDLLDKYDIIPKEGYMALLDKDFNNLGFPNDRYCVNCGKLLELNAKFCIYCGQRNETY
ncbi:MAG: zinc ribbon domain-containing protein [Promethearchaeota archaeon]